MVPARVPLNIVSASTSSSFFENIPILLCLSFDVATPCVQRTRALHARQNLDPDGSGVKELADTSKLQEMEYAANSRRKAWAAGHRSRVFLFSPIRSAQVPNRLYRRTGPMGHDCFDVLASHLRDDFCLVLLILLHSEAQLLALFAFFL